MKKAVQKRTLATRAKLIESAWKIISSKGYGALRVEEVVQDAAVAKGTFFAHFPDKDALMEIIIGSEIDTHLDALERQTPPENTDDFIRYLQPLMLFMTSERYVFDVILRHSGAAAKEEIGPIAQTFDRQVRVLAQWLSDGPYRKDVPAMILAEGIQAFAIQCMALHFCAINNELPIQKRMKLYLDAWLCPQNVS